MVRNIILAVSSLAVLIIVFWGYALLVGEPVGADSQGGVHEIPTQRPVTTEPMRLGDTLELPGGGRIMFRRYDEHTGRARDMFLCQDWQPVPGSKKEIQVQHPEMAMRLPSGMIATVSADEGRITVDRIEQSQMQPKFGWLAGDVRIVVDRETDPDRTPSVERPEDLITVRVDQLSFDLEIGELKTEKRVTVVSDDFEVVGTGLHLIWSQADNRIETLSIAQGEQFVLYAASGMFGLAPEPAEPPNAATSPATAPAKPHRPRRPLRVPAAYACTLTGGLVAEQYRGQDRIGGLDADEVHLLFDAGGAVGLMRPKSREAVTRPAREDRDRLVVHWTGRLDLEPVAPGPVGERNRRRFEAVGQPVAMTRGEGIVRCGKVAYHDDTRRVWLYPAEGGTVEFGLGPSTAATAGSVYIDRDARIIKLIGDVELRSRRGAGPTSTLSTMRADLWAELRLAEGARGEGSAPADGLVGAGQLESATFVGDVRVDLGGQKLTAHRLDVGFRADAGGQSLEELLDTAAAAGEVVLLSGRSRLESDELQLAFGLNADKEIYPSRMDAAGGVRIERDKAHIGGDRVQADLAAAPPGAEQGATPFVIRTLDVSGRAELIDPGNHLAARGRQIRAAFEGLNRLTTASVHAAGAELALVHARPYTVRGPRIDLDRSAQTLHVDGPSRLALRTERSLQGQRREKRTPIVVSSSRQLHIDGRRNTVRFEGDVVARSEEEQLRGDTLTLLMEDAPEPQVAESRPAWQEAWRQLRNLVGDQNKARPADDFFDIRVEDEPDRARKEPVRLVADNALVTSESFETGVDDPVVHASISAPLLEMDIVSRQITTTGQTDLLMTDRRATRETEPTRESLGIPSALITRGPSQTAMRCQGRMTYSLGSEGPDRRDTVVFEQQVVFVHRAGKEMVDLEEMLPQLAGDPQAVERLRSRNATMDCDRLECWFTVDAQDTTQRRGGALTRTPLRLASLLASGSVYLRDQEETRIREVNADWLEFNREAGIINVRGGPQADARIYVQDTQTGQFDPHVGKRVTINLKDGTIRSDRIEGELRRP